MPRRATPLTAQKVAKAKRGRFYDGDGLVLLVREASKFDPAGKLKEHGKAWWLYRYTLRGKTRDSASAARWGLTRYPWPMPV